MVHTCSYKKSTNEINIIQSTQQHWMPTNTHQSLIRIITSREECQVPVNK